MSDDDPGPRRRPRTDLPDVRHRHPPGAYVDWGDRLGGLLAVLIGVLGLIFVYVLHASPVLNSAVPLPGQAGGTLPLLINVTSCITPLVALGSLGLVAVGLHRLLQG